jgi:hypothetical protein
MRVIAPATSLPNVLGFRFGRLANCFPIPDSDRANFGNLATADAVADGFQLFFILSADGRPKRVRLCAILPRRDRHERIVGNSAP